ncbi:MAG: TonB-dependent receptor, partial [bacterium]
MNHKRLYHRYKALKLMLGLALLAFCGPLAFSQESTGSIRGVVTDQKGGAVAGATVTATSPALVRPIEVTTDGNGNYAFGSLPAGTYSVTAGQAGFSTVKKDDVLLQLGRELSLDLALPVGGVAETVNVTAGTEAIDVTSSKTVTNIGEERILISPKGRGFESILKLAPGVRADPKAGNEGVGGISVDGASGAENAFVLDGVEVTDVRKGQLRRADAIPFEFVREVQIKSGGFEAEYGGATGGVVNVVTKSGSNEFHGETAFSFTNSKLNSNGRGFWQIDPTNTARADFFRPPKQANDYYARYPGFSIGGPILKNRLTFFTSYFPEFIKDDRTVNYASGAKTFKQNIVRHYGLARLDYAPTSKLQINSSFIWTPTKVTGALPSSDPRVGAPTNDLRVQGGYTPSNSTSASLTYTPTSKWILSARVGYKYLNDKGATLNGAFTAGPGTYGLPGDSFREYFSNSSQQTSPPVPAQFAGNTGFRNISPNFFSLRDITTRRNLYLDMSYIASIFGQSHVLKGGYALNKLANDVEDDFVNGSFNIFWGEGFSRGAINQARGTYGYYVWQDGIRHKAKVKSRNQGFYIQDAWKIHPRLNLNLGVRFENEFLPPYTAVVNGVKVANPVAFGWGDKIAPRLGGAWDVYGNGKWKFSANYGVYYDVMKYELARGSFGGDYWF